MRYVDDTFNQTVSTTIGIDYRIQRVVIGNRLVKVTIWDTAGAERFRAITVAYYRGVECCVVCVNLTDAEAVTKVGRWVEEFRVYTHESAPAVVIGTKTDSPRRVVTEAEMQKACLLLPHVVYTECSAQSGEGVEEAIHTAMELAAEVKLAGQTAPAPATGEMKPFERQVVELYRSLCQPVAGNSGRLVPPTRASLSGLCEEAGFAARVDAALAQHGGFMDWPRFKGFIKEAMPHAQLKELCQSRAMRATFNPFRR